MKILIMGLPGSGKTWLGVRLIKILRENNPILNIPFWDADLVRKIYDDQDFTTQGREKQALRMRKLAETEPGLSICAFICPLPGFRTFFFPDIVIWMDTVQECKYEDLNKLFTPPDKYDVRITSWLDGNDIFKIMRDLPPILNKTDLDECMRRLGSLRGGLYDELRQKSLDEESKSDKSMGAKRGSKYTQQEWDRVVGWGTVPPEYSA
jgi:adenylylsulfate kinase